MITRVEALNYRCLRYIEQDLGPLHVLVGPNASGKTTFLDVVAFLGRLVSDGPEAAVIERTQNFEDLVWGRQGNAFQLAIEMAIPEQFVQLFEGRRYTSIRYEVEIESSPTFKGIGIKSERAVLKRTTSPANRQLELFPNPTDPPESILSKRPGKLVISKAFGGNDNYTSERGKSWKPAFKLGPKSLRLEISPRTRPNFRSRPGSKRCSWRASSRSC